VTSDSIISVPPLFAVPDQPLSRLYHWTRPRC